jgi:hypothetical protein
LLIYNLRPVHGKEKAPLGAELASRDCQARRGLEVFDILGLICKKPAS